MKMYKLNKALNMLAREERTGTLVCVGEDNFLGRVYVVDGKPRAARCRKVRGREALLLIDEKLLTALKFHNNLNLLKSESEAIDNAAMPNQYRRTGDTGARMAADFKSVIDIASVAEVDDDSSLSRIVLDDGIRSMMARELVNFLGPLAEMVVSDLDDGLNLQDALNLIADEIGDMDSALEFVSIVKSSI
jgi:hypothetical protein